MSPRPRVLVADDDADVLELVAFRLERAGYDVIRALDARRPSPSPRPTRPTSSSST